MIFVGGGDGRGFAGEKRSLPPPNFEEEGSGRVVPIGTVLIVVEIIYGWFSVPTLPPTTESPHFETVERGGRVGPWNCFQSKISISLRGWDNCRRKDG